MDIRACTHAPLMGEAGCMHQLTLRRGAQQLRGCDGGTLLWQDGPRLRPQQRLARCRPLRCARALGRKDCAGQG